jgi:hypothetical protein
LPRLRFAVADAKEAFGIDPGQLQAATPNVITKDSLASYASFNATASSDGGLKDTWKLDAKHLKSKLADGKPIILGEGIRSTPLCCKQRELRSRTQRADSISANQEGNIALFTQAHSHFNSIRFHEDCFCILIDRSF